MMALEGKVMAAAARALEGMAAAVTVTVAAGVVRGVARAVAATAVAREGWPEALVALVVRVASMAGAVGAARE